MNSKNFHFLYMLNIFQILSVNIFYFRYCVLNSLRSPYSFHANTDNCVTICIKYKLPRNKLFHSFVLTQNPVQIKVLLKISKKNSRLFFLLLLLFFLYIFLSFYCNTVTLNRHTCAIRNDGINTGYHNLNIYEFTQLQPILKLRMIILQHRHSKCNNR